MAISLELGRPADAAVRDLAPVILHPRLVIVGTPQRAHGPLTDRPVAPPSLGASDVVARAS